MLATILTVLVTVKSFLKSVSKDRFPKLKDFALQMRSTFGDTHTIQARNQGGLAPLEKYAGHCLKVVDMV